MKKEEKQDPVNRKSPEVEYEILAAHYASKDIPHVLARVRFMLRYFEEVVDENPETRKHLPDLQIAYGDRLNEEFAPYALNLALSLVSLEDSLAEEEPKKEK